jgi:repressor LexA
MIVLYENIKKFRKQMQISQEELAKRTGYTDRSSIAKIERGSVDLSQSKIQQFADVFGVSASELMGWENEKTATPKDSGMSEAKQQLLALAESCSDEEATRLLQMMELFLGKR